MTYETPDSLLLVLSRGAGGSRLTVDLESFLKFNAQMDQDLDGLVKQWAEFSTPASLRDDVIEARRQA